MSVKLYKVGGAVRDAFLGVKSKDIDYAVEAPSYDAMRQHILQNGGKIFLETPEYFTMRAIMPVLGAADFVLCRRDGCYKDGRRPESVDVGTIQDDLARRDFTINAIAIEVGTEKVIDPFNGQEDIKKKLIRFVGDPNKRLDEDKLRAFRAVRFVLTRNLGLIYESSAAIKCLSTAEFEGVSTERIREEINKMFAISSRASFQLLYEMFPVLGHVVDERGLKLQASTKQL